MKSGKVAILRFDRSLATAVSLALFLTTVLPAQQSAPAAAKPQAQPPQAQPQAQPSPPPASGPLKIVVLQGEGAKNNIRAKSATTPAIEVRDEAEKPVPGAEVIFQLPATGPGGVFHGWMRTQTVKSNAQGQATVTGYTPNEEEGRFNIKVTATTRTQSGSAVISQSNVRGTGSATSAKSSRSTLWKVVAVVGAAALGGGIYAATRGNGDGGTTAPTVPVTISNGPISVAGPR